MKKWLILSGSGDLIENILKNRGLTTKKEIEEFFHPPYPPHLPSFPDLAKAIERIKKAINNKESIVVYADYDADGVTAGAIMWETIYKLGGNVMPYIPHRIEEGYGLSLKGIDAVKKEFNPSLIITVDHGITAWEKIAYAKSLGIDVIVTDHHVKPIKLPDCLIVHTTELSGAGVSWCVAKKLMPDPDLSLAAIGTIADMMPLVGPNRSIVKFGLLAIAKTKRVGLEALMGDAGISKESLATYEVSHMIAPRLNAMGRIEHALDALRLLCTNNKEKARTLAETLGLKNRERQQLTADTTLHALGLVPKTTKKLIFIAHQSYNQGVIGLVAGKLVEEYYVPAIVVSKGEVYSKASARSIAGFNIVEAIRSASDLLVDVGGHPMAAGFTVETKNLGALQKRLEQLAEKEISDELLIRVLTIDAEIPLTSVTEELWKKLRDFEPFGFGNPEPVFATKNVHVTEARLVGADGKHLKLKIDGMEAIAFNFGKLYGELQANATVDIAYTIALDTWNGSRRLQLKVKDIHIV
ncbi:single-stranded-DNA-specific exonuclease RecJ [Candidatus Gottesmanbacteria bacterium RIFCSPHIGHO2_01_FULL_46_14]|uniref:Single-stranded-DNA-specific exonuclease RecJ n=3 Tax=Microgenomates group TaxID=1794810 RepID=A0A1F5ZPK6_9BACT|nr:MAG: Single-stranded-DNA-specific exonuclease RecJ [Candidatus Curtissbacteria bacterium GW2011_GWA1_41_11]OGG14420.1 MAG: single-stranded-DNA-specific exonuclease RecJ [Candidatus Gottesmanbacteria bacterium RIFCSPHIGHO2_01_FULL_46_14]OGG28561.1 MAG: single-stranded-DNA-specific exonuclease RecJ [Candidatus Gottesmanbacteria bacterium RIFCSPLOWO2_01_FULL_46_21]